MTDPTHAGTSLEAALAATGELAEARELAAAKLAAVATHRRMPCDTAAEHEACSYGEDE